ncbi:MAG: transposase family protein [Blastocatellia bacterium]
MKGNENPRANSEQLKRGLTRRQELALSSLLSKPTMKEAAEAAGIGETTLWRWLQIKGFHTAYMKARRESVKQGIARLQNATGEAVTVLQEIMSDKESPRSVRVTAAKAIIEYSIKAVEIEDLAQRVEELEAVMAAAGKPKATK